MRRRGLGVLLVGMACALAGCSDNGDAGVPSPTPTNAVSSTGSVAPTGPGGSSSAQPTSATYDPNNPPPSLTVIPFKRASPETLPFNRIVTMPVYSEPTKITASGIGTGRGILLIDVIWVETDLDRGCDLRNTDDKDPEDQCYERLWWAKDIGRRVVEGLTEMGETSSARYEAAKTLAGARLDPECHPELEENETWGPSCWAQRDDIHAKVIALRDSWPPE